MRVDSFQGEYRFLSNFWPAVVEFEGLTYPSVENAYQAAKTADHTARIPFTQMTAGQSKKDGRLLTIRDDWASVKLSVMEDLVRKKFSIPELRELLNKTGNRELIEGNTWNDTFWGVCRGVGENHLGKILMKVRSEGMKVRINRAQIGTGFYTMGIDTTVKSALGVYQALAPTWPMVMGHKEGRLSDDEYAAMYEKILDAAPESVYEALYQAGVANGGWVTVLCYCRDSWFCHTHLLISYVCEVWPDRFIDGR